MYTYNFNAKTKRRPNKWDGWRDEEGINMEHIQTDPTTMAKPDNVPVRPPRRRTTFTVEQLYLLEMYFAQSQYVGCEERERLARLLSLDEYQVCFLFISYLYICYESLQN